MVLYLLRDKGKPRCKLSYYLFKENEGYDIWIEISLFPTIIQLTGFIGGESFQLKMGFSFPFLRANDLRLSLLNIRARSF